MTTDIQIGECGKRCFSSASAVRRCRKYSFRLRAYRCERCRAWHATSSEKR